MGEQKTALILSIMLLFVLAGSVSISLVGASSEMWSKTYGNGKEVGNSLVETSDGGFAVAGDTGSFGAGGSDFWLVKTDSNGNMEWNRTYGGAEDESAKAVIKTSDGGFAMAGNRNPYEYSECDCWFVKTDSYGNMEWNQTYGGPDYDCANALIETSDGGYAIAGGTLSFGAGETDFWLVKTDAQGNMKWNQTYGGADAETSTSLVETHDGGYALAGGRTGLEGGVPGFYPFDNTIWLVKTDVYGNMEWNQTYGERLSYKNAHSLVATSDGGFAMGGYVPDGHYSDFWLIKTDSKGDMEWSKSFGRGGDEKAYSMVQTSDGGYALAGIASGAIGTEAYLDSWMVKTDADGNEIWRQTYAETGDQYIYSLVETSDDAFALAGWKTYTSTGPPYLWIIKTDEYGYIPEFPSWTILPLLLAATALIVVCRKRLTKHNRILGA